MTLNANDSESNDKESALVGANSEINRQAIASKLVEEIDSYTAWKYANKFRWHLGASKIGEECRRSIWYLFRWADLPETDGRTARLLNRGDLEEPRHAEWLRGIGCQLWTHDDSAPLKADGSMPQYRIKNKCKGHLGGSLDGILKLPERYGIDLPFILESKTSGTGSKFSDLGKKGMTLAKPVHYAQNSIYGESYGIENAVYICANKNDDDLYLEVVKLNFDLAKKLEKKAEEIIFSQEPPPKISENSAYFTCKSLCDFKDVCHNGKPLAVNCRSCINAVAVDNAEFYCALHDGIIPRNVVPDACPSYLPIVFKSKKIVPIKPVADSLGFEIESDIPIPPK